MRLKRTCAAAASVLVVVATARGQGRPAAEGVPDERDWNRRPPGAGDYQFVMEVSGRAEVGRVLDIPPPGGGLQQMRDARKEAGAAALSATERDLAGLEAAPPGRRDLSAIAHAHQELGQLFAYDGRMDRAIAEMEAAYGIVSKDPPGDPSFVGARAFLEAVLGVLQLRRGELENCVHDHNAARCIFPIRGPGQHDQPSGSAAAVEYFRKHLRRDPGDLEVRWLNNGDGTFSDVTAKAGLSRAVRRTHSAVWADYDNDGWLDVFVGHEESPSALFRNRGDGTFEDVAHAAGVDAKAFTKGAAWGDYD